MTADGPDPRSGVKPDGSWVPAFEGQRPPHARGNALSIRHGAYSAVLVSDDAAQMLEELRELGAPWLQEVDGAEVAAWLRAEAMVRRLWSYLEEHGPLDPKGKPRSAGAELRSWERTAASRRAALGISPSARAVLGRDTAVARAAAASSLRVELERGRQVLDARSSALPADEVLDEPEGVGGVE